MSLPTKTTTTTDRKLKRKLATTSPPKRKAKGVKNSEVDCLICDEPILEPSEHCEGDEAVFCEGNCQGWIHRKCAGITRPAFDKLGEPDTQYLCSYCMLVSQNNEISKLAGIIKDLNSSIVSLTETITLLQSSVTKKSTSDDQQTSTFDQTANTTTDTTVTKKTNVHESPQQDRKFNVVIYGIEECAKGMPRHERSGLDLSNISRIITKVDENINPLSIRDLHRLGKYQEQSKRPRPILVRFNRAIDVSILLSKASSLPNSIRIKPDLTPDERKTESILLKERWALIQKETERKAIKIRGSRIFVNNKLHGEVKNSSLVLSQMQTSPEEGMDQENI